MVAWLLWIRHRDHCCIVLLSILSSTRLLNEVLNCPTWDSNFLSGLYKWQMKTGYVALALCLNIGVDPPDVIKISPCARMECWIGNRLVITLFFTICRLATEGDRCGIWFGVGLVPFMLLTFMRTDCSTWSTWIIDIDILFWWSSVWRDTLWDSCAFADPFSTTSSKALDAIGKNLQVQYERWQPRVRKVFLFWIWLHIVCFQMFYAVISKNFNIVMVIKSSASFVSDYESFRSILLVALP